MKKGEIKRKPLFQGVQWSAFIVALVISFLIHVIIIALTIKPEEAKTPVEKFAVKIISKINPRIFKRQASSPNTTFTPIPREGGTEPMDPLSPDEITPEIDPDRRPVPPPPYNNGTDTKPPPSHGPEKNPVSPPPGSDTAFAPRHVVVPHRGPGPGMHKALNLIKENRFEDARALIEKELQNNPDNVQAIVAMGELEASRGKLLKAREIYEKAHKVDPKSTLPLDRLIIQCLILDDPDSSLEYYKKAEEIEGRDDFQKDSLAEIYLQRGATRKRQKNEKWKEDAKKTREALEKVGRKDTPLVQATFGKLAMLEGNQKKAIKHFEKIVDSDEIQNGYRMDILMALSVLYTELGDKKKAVEYIDKLVAMMDKWTPDMYERGLLIREFALLYKETYLGVDVNPDLAFTHERFYKKLYREKIQRPEVEVKQTLFILSEMMDMVYDEPLHITLDEVNEYMSITEGPKYPQCFFNKTVNQPVRYMIGYMLFGDTYYHNLKKDKAIYYYKKALEYSPGNKVLLEKIERAKKL